MKAPFIMPSGLPDLKDDEAMCQPRLGSQKGEDGAVVLVLGNINADVDHGG